MSKLDSKLFRTLFLGGFASILYGSIAVYANWDHEAFLIIKAGLSQGVLSFSATFFASQLIEKFYSMGKHWLSKIILSIIGAGGIMLILITTVHWIMGTPEIFRTVLYSGMMAIPYYILYPTALEIRSRRLHDQEKC